MSLWSEQSSPGVLDYMESHQDEGGVHAKTDSHFSLTAPQKRNKFN